MTVPVFLLPKKHLCILLALVCWLGWHGLPGAAQGAEFSAQVHHQRHWRTSDRTQPPETISVKGDWIRLETFRRGKPLVRIHRPDLKVTFDMDPGARSYKELPCMAGGEWFSWYPAYKAVLKAGGRETISGKTCIRYALPGNAAVFWVCPELDFPLRIVIGNVFLELSDIRSGPVDDALFAPPAGYRLSFSYFNGKTSPAKQAGAASAASQRKPRVKTAAAAARNGFDTALHRRLPFLTSAFYDFPLKMFVRS